MRKGDRANLEEEFADVFAWLASLATLEGIDLEAASGKYADGCPKCHRTPCACEEALTVAKTVRREDNNPIRGGK